MIRVTKLFIRPEIAKMLLQSPAVYHIAQSFLSLAQFVSMAPASSHFEYNLKANLSELLRNYDGGNVDSDIAKDFYKASVMSQRVEASISPGKEQALNVHILFFRKDSKDMHYEIFLEICLFKSLLFNGLVRITRTGFVGHGPEMAS